jgi:hypothetical protein
MCTKDGPCPNGVYKAVDRAVAAMADAITGSLWLNDKAGESSIGKVNEEARTRLAKIIPQGQITPITWPDFNGVMANCYEAVVKELQNVQ